MRADVKQIRGDPLTLSQKLSISRIYNRILNYLYIYDTSWYHLGFVGGFDFLVCRCGWTVVFMKKFMSDFNARCVGQ